MNSAKRVFWKSGGNPWIDVRFSFERCFMDRDSSSEGFISIARGTVGCPTADLLASLPGSIFAPSSDGYFESKYRALLSALRLCAREAFPSGKTSCSRAKPSSGEPEKMIVTAVEKIVVENLLSIRSEEIPPTLENVGESMLTLMSSRLGALPFLWGVNQEWIPVAEKTARFVSFTESRSLMERHASIDANRALRKGFHP